MLLKRKKGGGGQGKKKKYLGKLAFLSLNAFWVSLQTKCQGNIPCVVNASQFLLIELNPILCK